MSVFVAQSSETTPVPLTSAWRVPGSSRSPAQFISYTECSVDVFSAHGVQ